MDYTISCMSYKSCDSTDYKVSCHFISSYRTKTQILSPATFLMDYLMSSLISLILNYSFLWYLVKLKITCTSKEEKERIKRAYQKESFYWLMIGNMYQCIGLGSSQRNSRKWTNIYLISGMSEMQQLICWN